MDSLHTAPQSVSSLCPMYRVLCGNALDVLKTLATASIDMCMTSPPSWSHRDYDAPGIGQEPTHEEYVTSWMRLAGRGKKRATTNTSHPRSDAAS